MLEHTRGIVLNLIKYSDSASIAHIYTENSGRVSVMIRHSKSRKSVSKKSILQPLFLLDMQINRKQNREIHYSSEFSNSPAFQTIPFNPLKSSIVLFLAEILSKVLKEEEANSSMFNFLFNAIQLLDHLKHSVSSFHLVFIYELSRYLGFYPSNNYSELNRFFNLRDGMFTNIPDSPEITLNESLSKDLQQLKEKGFNKMEEIKMNRIQRNLLLQSMINYFHFHMPEMGQIKSLDVLNEIYK